MARKPRKSRSPRPAQPARTGATPSSRPSLSEQFSQANRNIDLEANANPWLLVIALAATSVFMFFYYHLLALPEMAGLADGQRMLEHHVTGYGLNDAQQLAASMDSNDRGQLNFTHKTAGVIFPLSVALAVATTVAFAVPRGRLGVFRGQAARVVIWVLCGVFAVVDIVENIVIEQLLEHPSAALASIASLLTCTSWAILLVLVGYAVSAVCAMVIRNKTQARKE